MKRHHTEYLDRRIYLLIFVNDISFKITIYNVCEREKRDGILAAVLGSFYLQLDANVCLAVSRVDRVKRSGKYIFICKRNNKPRIKSHLSTSVFTRNLLLRSVACPQQLRRKDGLHYHLSAASPTVRNEFIFPPRDGSLLLQENLE